MTRFIELVSDVFKFENFPVLHGCSLCCLAIHLSQLLVLFSSWAAGTERFRRQLENVVTKLIIVKLNCIETWKFLIETLESVVLQTKSQCNGQIIYHGTQIYIVHVDTTFNLSVIYYHYFFDCLNPTLLSLLWSAESNVPATAFVKEPKLLTKQFTWKSCRQLLVTPHHRWQIPELVCPYCPFPIILVICFLDTSRITMGTR